MFTSVSRRDPWGPLGLDVSVRAVAGVGQWGPPLLNGSADKLIDFISVSHTTPNPYWPDIHMFTAQRIMLLPSSVYLFVSFSLFQFFLISPTTFLLLLICLLFVMFCLQPLLCFISLPYSTSPPFFLNFWREHFKFSLRARLHVGAPPRGRLVGGRRSPCFLGHSSG